MANNFISNNSPQKTLGGRLNNIIKFSTELRWIVGFFYFSGWKEVYESLKKNPEINIRMLVGLQVGNHLSKIFEHDIQDVDLSSDDYFNDFMTSMGFAINNEQQDTKEFYEQVHFFLEMVQQGRLIIRKTREPNHAKLYLFKMNEEERAKHNFDGYLITGSSNLTRAGLLGQQEFNVEIKDYGYDDAVQYFEELWENAILISEIEERKIKLIDFILHRSQAAFVKPYEAYALVLKTFLDLQNIKKLKPKVEQLLEKNGFQKYSYQLDAVNQALGILEENNGVVIADVVGLGKSVVASLIARNLDTKGIIICPPGLMGNFEDRTGWWGYVRNFELNGWHVYSRGAIEDLAENLDHSDIETVIIDEAHSYRNQDTEAYEALTQICRGKKVILLTATPFNNSPADIFSLLKLFIIPGKSAITLEDNLEGLFRQYNYRFNNLSDILKNYHSENNEKRRRAEKQYTDYLGKELPVNPQVVRHESATLAKAIKEVIAPVTIRRNRLDLEKDVRYKREIGPLPKVVSPEELFYFLTTEQSEFYDRIVSTYFSENGIFTGAIYRPAHYKSPVKVDEMGLEENRAFQQQRNLYDFMRRLLVKRFESSFGAFGQTIGRFIDIHEIVLQFIENSGGRYILDRGLMEKIYEEDEEDILSMLNEFENNFTDGRKPKNTTVYDVNEFYKKDEFLKDIREDLKLFKRISKELNEENLVEKDPKRVTIFQKINEILGKEPNRKVVLFTEYVDTVRHLEPYFRQKFGDRILICDGNVNKAFAKSLEQNFNAQFKGKHTNDFDLLITSDKLSEGFNLNRAGAIINYDIPWNPTRVIQRVGRINRIGKKVFNELFIFNFFPSEIGADFVKSREIAQQKMFMIHNALGEDARIFDPDEEPTASGLFKKLNDTPEEEEEISLLTKVRNLYSQIVENHPEVIDRVEKLPERVKTAKIFKESNVNVLRRKGLGLFAQNAATQENPEVLSLAFEDFLNFVSCEFGTERISFSSGFWPTYEIIKANREKIRSIKTDLAIETRAYENLMVALKLIDASEDETIDFVRTLIKDLKHYYTMPKYTLRRLTFEKLTGASPKTSWNRFFQELEFIRNRYGPDYLDNILERVSEKKEEVIIAVENRNNEFF